MLCIVSVRFIKQDNSKSFLLKSLWKGAENKSQNLTSKDKQQNSEIPSYPSEELDWLWYVKNVYFTRKKRPFKTS